MPISDDYRIDALLRGETYRWNQDSSFGTQTVVTYAFSDSRPAYYAEVPDYYITGVQDASYTYQSLDGAHREIVRQEFALLSAAVPGIRFVEVSDAEAAVTVVSAYSPTGTGAANVSSDANGFVPNGGDAGGRASGDIWFRASSETYDLTATWNGYQVQPTWFADMALHEIGHTIGFKHPGNYNPGSGSDSPPYLPTAEDDSSNTVMSYNGNYAGPEPRAYDILAGQFLYGAQEPADGQWLLASDGNSRIEGSALGELICLGSGNHTVNGGEGTDVASYSGALSGYSIVISAGSYVVTAAGGSAADTLSNVEKVRCSDLTVNLTVQAGAAATNSAQLARLEELYVAFFNRVPDADGLEYWIGQFASGQTVNQIAESFYAAGVQYSSLTGYSSTMTNADFVNTVYRNVLGRSEGADADGLAYWTGELTSGRESHGSLVSTILDSAHSFKGNATWGWVADLLDNKITVANHVAVELGLTNNDASAAISSGMAIAAAVTASSTTEAISLIGVAPGQISLA